MGNKMLDAALEYARMGLAVFPLVERGKVPAVANGNKSATTNLEYIREAWTQRPNCNIGIATGEASGGLVVIDVDVSDDEDENGYQTLKAWETERGELPETATCITGTNGMHLYYRTDKPLRNSTGGAELGIDIRANGGHVVAPPSIHPNGREYEFEQYIEDAPIAQADDNVLAFIDHIQGQSKSRGRFTMPDKVGKGERNDMLFRLACSYQEKGYDDNILIAAIHTANARTCDPPLPDDEVDKVIESALAYPKGEAAENIAIKQSNEASQSKSSAFSHSKFAKDLIKRDHACRIDGAPAIWDGSRYSVGWAAIDHIMIKYKDDIKEAQRKEVRNYLQTEMPEVEASSPNLIAFTNGVYDVDKGEVIPYSPDMIITNIIPHECDFASYDKTTDDFLDRISCFDPITRNNLEEIIGLCMYRSNDFDMCPVLIGSGANGKSTFIAALRNVLGVENVSSLDLNIVGKQFQAGRLLGKLANLGDDISNEFLRGDILSVFKKIVSGEWIYTDVKGTSGFEFKPYCTLVFSCNEFPALGDSSDGMIRRLFPILFNAHFTRGDASYDPKIADKVMTGNAARYLVNLGVIGLQRMFVNNGFTPNTESESLAKEVQRDNNNILQWLEDAGMDRSDLIYSAIPVRFEEYKDWCKSNGVKNVVKHATFTRRLNTHFHMKSSSRTYETANGRKSFKTFVEP